MQFYLLCPQKAVFLRVIDELKINNLLNFKLFLFMAKIHGAVVVNTERCKGCRLCVVACPCNVLNLKEKEVNDRGYHFAYMEQPEACIGCQSCALVCPDACIEVYRVTEK